MNDIPLPKRCLCEVLNTFILVLIGCGAMVVNGQKGDLTHVGVALTWGLVVMIMIYATGRISGAHMNPAVTIAMTVFGKMKPVDAVGYIIAQCLGAVAAAGCLRVVLGLDETLLGATNSEMSAGAAFAIEFTMTAILLFVVMGVSTGASEEGVSAGLAVGATIGIEAMVAGPLTKASMNPARSFGPAVMSGDLNQLWIYIAAPISGAIAGVILYRLVQSAQPPEDSQG